MMGASMASAVSSAMLFISGVILSYHTDTVRISAS